MEWIKDVVALCDKEVIAIDGKTLRRSYKNKDCPPIDMVSAWACANGITLGQYKVKDKSNEITAIPKMLKLLEIKGCIVTIDAMGTQKEIAKDIIKAKADYVLALKGNHKHLFNEISDFFSQTVKEEKHIENMLDFYETLDKGHGREEHRRDIMLSNTLALLDTSRGGREPKALLWSKVIV